MLVSTMLLLILLGVALFGLFYMIKTLAATMKIAYEYQETIDDDGKSIIIVKEQTKEITL